MSTTNSRLVPWWTVPDFMWTVPDHFCREGNEALAHDINHREYFRFTVPTVEPGPASSDKVLTGDHIPD